jgi:hypothetical protein
MIRTGKERKQRRKERRIRFRGLSSILEGIYGPVRFGNSKIKKRKLKRYGSKTENPGSKSNIELDWVKIPISKAYRDQKVGE